MGTKNWEVGEESSVSLVLLKVCSLVCKKSWRGLLG